MAVTISVKWYDKELLKSVEEIKISDTISRKHFIDVYKNYRFDDYYLIKDAEKEIKDYIFNSWKHKYYSAEVKEDFLPIIIIKEDPDV